MGRHIEQADGVREGLQPAYEMGANEGVARSPLPTAPSHGVVKRNNRAGSSLAEGGEATDGNASGPSGVGGTTRQPELAGRKEVDLG
jgi:hypothetical protein